jgi:hypothetical protein
MQVHPNRGNTEGEITSMNYQAWSSPSWASYFSQWQRKSWWLSVSASNWHLCVSSSLTQRLLESTGTERSTFRHVTSSVLSGNKNMSLFFLETTEDRVTVRLRLTTWSNILTRRLPVGSLTMSRCFISKLFSFMPLILPCDDAYLRAEATQRHP